MKYKDFKGHVTSLIPLEHIVEVFGMDISFYEVDNFFGYLKEFSNDLDETLKMILEESEIRFEFSIKEDDNIRNSRMYFGDEFVRFDYNNKAGFCSNIKFTTENSVDSASSGWTPTIRVTANFVNEAFRRNTIAMYNRKV
uniref:Uncharacterized protein n=1 Tax=Rhizobium phage IG49 TaxID=3129228 RepID=A0AAU8HZM3_9CAUD